LGEVVGAVVASQKVKSVSGQKLLLVQPLDELRAPVGSREVAVDTVSAGPGDLVYLVGSMEAAMALEDTFAPVDAAVVGIVDDLNVTKKGAGGNAPV